MNRRTLGRVLLAAVGAAGTTDLEAAAATDETRRLITAASVSDLRNLRVHEDAVQVLGYYRPGDQGGGLFVWQANSTTADDRGVVIAPSDGCRGRWIRHYSGPVDVQWFGTFAGGSQDSAPAIDAALGFAAAQSPVPDVYIPAGRFMIARTIIVSERIVRIFGEGVLVGNMQRSPPIHGPVPAADEVPKESDPGCLAGSCFYFPTLGYHLVIEGLAFTGFRFALAWFTAHNSPTVCRCTFLDCNVAAMFYQGSQTSHFVDCATHNVNVFVVAAATCFHATHPLRDKDNFYCDGLTVSNSGANRRHYIQVNSHFDTWFRESILRPDTASYTPNGKSGFLLQSPIRDIDKPTGRFIYLPFRNPRLCFSLTIRDLDFGACPRGVACVNTDLVGALFQNIASEGMFSEKASGEDAPAMFVLGQGERHFSVNLMINVGIGIDRKRGVLINWATRPDGVHKYWKIIGGYPEEIIDPQMLLGCDIV